jgi:hypothetical protein
MIKSTLSCQERRKARVSSGSEQMLSNTTR